MSKVLKGKKLIVFVNTGTSETPSWKSIALSTNHTLTLNASTTELAVKTKDDAEGKTWADSEIDTMSWSISSESLVASDSIANGEGFADIMDLYLAGQKVMILIDDIATNGNFISGTYQPVNATTPFQGMKGEAIITSLTLNAPLEDNASYSVEFTGCGELKKA